jgi:hypothetical protein
MGAARSVLCAQLNSRTKVARPLLTCSLSPGAPTIRDWRRACGFPLQRMVQGVGFAANASFSAALSGIPTTAVLLRSGYHIGNSGLGLVLGMLGIGIAVSELLWGTNATSGPLRDIRVWRVALGTGVTALPAVKAGSTSRFHYSHAQIMYYLWFSGSCRRQRVDSENSDSIFVKKVILWRRLPRRFDAVRNPQA